MSTTITQNTTSTAAPPPRAARRIRCWDVLCVGALTTTFATLYALYLLRLHATLQDGMMDIAEFDQAISSYAHFMAPHSPFIGLPSTDSAGQLQLSDHFTPLLVVLAPAYWIHDGPTTLLVETAILAALPVIPVWLFARRTFASASTRSKTGAAYLIAIGYGLSWPVQTALAFEFHEVFLACPIMAWMLERAQAGRLRQAALISLLLLGVKDDMGFVVAAFGVYLAAKGVPLRAWRRLTPRAVFRRDRRPYLLLIPVGLGMVGLVNEVLLPMFGASSKRNFTYGQFGSGPTQALVSMLSHPAFVAQNLVDPPTKLNTLLMLLCPVLALCLFSPITLLAVPLILERFLSTNDLYWGLSLHYNAFLVPILFCAGIDGAARLSRVLSRSRVPVRRRPAVPVPLILGAWAAIFGLAAPFPLQQTLHPSFWTASAAQNVDITAGRAVLAHIPSGTLVAAADYLGPQLLGRDEVVMWTSPGDRDYPHAPWVLADVGRLCPPFPSIAAQTANVRLLESEGYRIVFRDDGYLVLHLGLPSA